jgi:hypothetical protein
MRTYSEDRVISSNTTMKINRRAPHPTLPHAVFEIDHTSLVG